MGLTKRTGLILSLAVLVFGAVDAPAQSSDEWEFQIAPLYLWAITLDGSMTVRGQEAPFTVNIGDVFDKLEGVFTVHFEGFKGDWGFITDFSYVDISAEGELPPPDATIGVDFKNLIVMASAAYRFDESAFVYFGGRYYSVDPTITLPMDVTIDEKQGWVDPIVGIGWRPELSNRWTFAGSVDVGGFGVASDVSFSAVAAFDYRLSRHAALFFGYRLLDYDYKKESDQFAYDVNHRGPVGALRFFW